MTSEVQRRKLIEVALPLEAINRESAREKSIRHGHPSTLHLWWARRPLAAARAVLFAQLVDDPSSRPDRFPTEEDQQAERERLHGIVERLVVWENMRDERLLRRGARGDSQVDRRGSAADSRPVRRWRHDPARGAAARARGARSDLNPVAVLINKALIEIPPKFADRPPVFPGAGRLGDGGWTGAAGLADDVRAYGEWMRDEAESGSASATRGDAARRRHGEGDRLDLGPNGDLPEPGVRDRDAVGAFVVAG